MNNRLPTLIMAIGIIIGIAISLNAEVTYTNPAPLWFDLLAAGVVGGVVAAIPAAIVAAADIRLPSFGQSKSTV